MSKEQLEEYLVDIKLRMRTDPKAVINLLQIITSSSLELAVIESVRAERLLREVSGIPLTSF
jgi:hypothetical protein